MGNDGASYRRIRIRNDGAPVEGLYDSVVDARLKALLDAAERAGVAIGTRALKGRDGRLLARELATALVDAIESKLGAEEAATPADVDIVNRLLREAARAARVVPPGGSRRRSGTRSGSSAGSSTSSKSSRGSGRCTSACGSHAA